MSMFTNSNGGYVWLCISLGVCYWIVCFNPTEGYPGGVPRSSCVDGMPHHHMSNGTIFSPQPWPCPFIITVSSMTYLPGDKLHVTMKTTTDEGFKGFLIRVRSIRSKLRSSFTLPPRGFYDMTDSNVKTINCQELHNAISHTNGELKNEIEFDWSAPLYATEYIYFEATIVANYSTYWVNVTSDVIRLIRADIIPPERLEIPWLIEILKTVKAKQDKNKRRQLTMARFNRGYDGVLDTEGNLIIQYVVNILPFNTSFQVEDEIAHNIIASEINVLLGLADSTLSATGNHSNGATDQNEQETISGMNKMMTEHINGNKSLVLAEADSLSKTNYNLTSVTDEAEMTTTIKASYDKASNVGSLSNMEVLVAYLKVVKEVLTGDIESVNAMTTYLHSRNILPVNNEP